MAINSSSNDLVQEKEAHRGESFVRPLPIDLPVASTASTKPKATLSTMHIFFICFVLRVSLAALMRTTFVPDEYYQSVERAYQLVFNHGITTWEWQHDYQIRSHIYIIPYIIYFTLLKVLNINWSLLYTVGPRILTAIFVSISDICLYLLSINIANTRYKSYQSHTIGYITLFIHLSSWPVLYMGSRTLANTSEMSFLIIITYIWHSIYWHTIESYATTTSNSMISLAIDNDHNDKPVDKEVENVLPDGSEEYVIMLMSIATCARPTALPIFTSMVLHRMYTHGILRLLWRCILYGGFVLTICCIIDTGFYGGMVKSNHGSGITGIIIPFLNFFNINTIYNISSLYGKESMYWNLLHGLPVMIGGYLPFVLCGILNTCMNSSNTYFNMQNLPKSLKQLCYYGCVGLFFQTMMSSHQEIRFLLPYMLYVSLLLGYMLGSIWLKYCNERQTKESDTSMNNNKKIISTHFVLKNTKFYFLKPLKS